MLQPAAAKNVWWPFWLWLLPFGGVIAGIVIYKNNPKGSIVRKTYWWILASMFGVVLIAAITFSMSAAITAVTTQNVLDESARAEVIVDGMSGAQVEEFCAALAVATDLRGEEPARQAAYEAFAAGLERRRHSRSDLLEVESRC